MSNFRTIAMFLLVSFSSWGNQDVEHVLDKFHLAASKADYESYFALLADNAIFLGTDGTERWTKQSFSAFVKPYFSQGRGWLYQPIERNISSTPQDNIVFFDELLSNSSYGLCRGSGVLINTDSGWKIMQYNLSIPVPNALAKNVKNLIEQETNGSIGQ